MTFQDIKEIRALITMLVADKIAAGQLVNQTWTVTEILNRHDDIEGSDKDFYLVAARHWVNGEVKSAIGKYEPTTSSENDQLVLDGFEYLQKAYPLLRGAVRVLVPINQITNAEWDAKEKEYERMGDGCYAHAREIRDYRSSRQQTA